MIDLIIDGVGGLGGGVGEMVFLPSNDVMLTDGTKEWLRSGTLANGGPYTTFPDWLRKPASEVPWTQYSITSANWEGMAYGNGVFVVVAYNSSTCATSINGVTWSVRALPSLREWQTITFGNGLFVTVARNSSVYATSPDGITWTQRTLPTSGMWEEIRYAGGKFVLIDYAPSPVNVLTSVDGITWTPQTFTSFGSGYLTIGHGNGTYVVLARNTNTMVYSADAVSWNSSTLPLIGSWESVAYGAGLFVAVVQDGDQYATSPDGINWTQRTLPITASTWYEVIYGAGIFTLISRSTSTCLQSVNGIDWFVRTFQSPANWHPIATNDEYVVTIGYGSTNVARSLTAIDYVGSDTFTPNLYLRVK